MIISIPVFLTLKKGNNLLEITLVIFQLYPIYHETIITLFTFLYWYIFVEGPIARSYYTTGCGKRCYTT